MTRILLADDHPMIASALEMLFRGSGYEMVGRARTGKEALIRIAELDPDLALLDVNMPDGSGIDILAQLRRSGARQKIVLLTAGMDSSQLIAASNLEPDGIVFKTSDPALLLTCLDQVSAGRRWIDPEVQAQIDTARELNSVADSFTPRERELIDLVAQGLRNRDIAERLGITEGTVKVYLHAIFEKAGVASRTELALKAGNLRA